MPIMVELFLGHIACPMLRDTIVTDSDSLETKPHFLSRVNGCDSAHHCAFCSVIGSSDIVGLAFCSEEGNVIGVTRFETSIPWNDTKHLFFGQFNLHVVLVSDLEFTHTVLGLQSCSSTNPCCLCLVKLDDLRKTRSTAEGEPRNRPQFNAHLTEVKKGNTLKEKRKLAKENGSVFQEPLISICFDRIMLPILHIILRVMKKLWDNLESAIHRIEIKEYKEIKMLLEAPDNLSRHLLKLAESKDQVLQEFSTAEEQWREAHQNYSVVRKMIPPLSDDELSELMEQYIETWEKKADAAERKKKFNNDEIDFYATLITDLTEYIKLKQGPIERQLEWVISSYPILAKHNPYFGGSFNGNDCIRILENVQTVFSNLHLALESLDEGARDSASALINNYYDIWDSFASIVPQLRSTRKLSVEQQEDLLSDTEAFAKINTTKTKESVIYKMHILFDHLKERLTRYGTVGFRAEDSNEAIHAVVNKLDKVYAALDQTRKTVCILQSIKATSQRSLAQQEQKKQLSKKCKR